MRELDKTKVYDLSELTSEELQKIYKIVFEPTRRYKSLEFSDGSWGFNNSKEKNRTNAKELFYTLENIQVNCRDLSNIKIQNMSHICIKEGYKYFEDNKQFALSIGLTNTYFQITEDREIIVDAEEENKQTITYDKFIELFGNEEKSEEFNNLVEVLNEELTEEAYKETEYEVKYIAEKPKQYQIGIDTFQRCEANMTKEEILACCKFNIDKYNWRNKGQDLEDLEKIIAYANWGIKQLKQQ